jgi:hypothetical protein
MILQQSELDIPIEIGKLVELRVMLTVSRRQGPVEAAAGTVV